MKRILVIADLHCGSRVGLTPPDWWSSEPSFRKWHRIQRAAWTWYAREIEAGKPYDLIVVNGDAIDGAGDRSGGVEQITTDRAIQVEMATACIRRAMGKRSKVILLRGTPYHVGLAEDWEDILGGEVDAVKVGNHEWFKFGGVIFDFKHVVGSSAIPHGRSTALAREWLWNQLWASRGEAPKADVIVRSHVHYCRFTGEPDWLAMSTPALMSLGTRYGARLCSGLVHFGFVTFDCEAGAYAYQIKTASLREALPKMMEM